MMKTKINGNNDDYFRDKMLSGTRLDELREQFFAEDKNRQCKIFNYSGFAISLRAGFIEISLVTSIHLFV